MNKICIFTVCYNTPEYISYQYNLLKKYIENEFEYIVFDNTYTEHKNDITLKNKQRLEQVCNENKIELINIPENIFEKNNNGVSYRAGISITYAFQYLLDNNYDILFLIDSDMFLFDNFNIENELEKNAIYGIPQSNAGILYFTNQLFIVDKKQIKNTKNIDFTITIINNKYFDCGYKINKILIEENIRYKSFENIICGTLNKVEITNNKDKNEMIYDYLITDRNIILKKQDCLWYFGEIYNRKFLHMRAGTNWINSDKNDRETNLFKLLNALL